MEGNKILTIKDYIRFFAPFIIALCIVILAYSAFKIGVMYSCEGGILKGNRCITPKIIETLQVCEYKKDCTEICKMYEIKDKEKLGALYNITI